MYKQTILEMFVANETETHGNDYLQCALPWGTAQGTRTTRLNGSVK